MQRDTRSDGQEFGRTGLDSSAMGMTFLQVVSRFRLLIVSVTIAAGLCGYGLSFLQSTTYEATATMLLTDPRTSGVFEDRALGISDLSRYVRNQAEFTESSAVSERALELLGGSLTVEEVSKSVSAEPSQDLDVVTIRASRPTAEGAAALADAVAEAYEQLVAEQVKEAGAAAVAELNASKAELQSQISALEETLANDPGDAVAGARRDAAVAQLVNLDTRIGQIDVNVALYGSGVQYFEPAQLPESPTRPRPLRNAAIAAVLGLLGAVAVAWWRGERSPVAESRHDPAPLLGVPLLGEIPEFASIGAEGPGPVIRDPESVAAEAYRFLASSIDFALEHVAGSTVLITSSLPEEGKTVTALNLAAAATGQGVRVVLVDADERARGLSLLGGDSNVKGLTDLSRPDGPTLRECLVRWRVTEDHHIMVLPGGSKQAPGGFLRSKAFEKIIGQLRDASGLVILDSPPLLSVAETLDLASVADCIVLVVAEGTPLSAVAEAAERLSMVGKPLIGYVFNRASRSSHGYGQDYAYGYGYRR